MKQTKQVWTMHPAEVAVFDYNAAALGIPLIKLLRAAGEALADAAKEMLEPTTNQKVTIGFLCGPGNNGGDGYAAALELQKQGYQIEIIASANRQHSEEAQFFREQCLGQKGITHYMATESEKFQAHLSRYNLLVDCFLGAGFHGNSLRGPLAKVIELCATLALPPVLACDIPSGLTSDMTLVARRTLTFHAPKLSMYCEGKLCPQIGILQVADLPWPAASTDCGPGEILRLPPLNPRARKGDRGRLLVVGGGPYYGAPLLAAQAAARTGCDLIHLAMPCNGRASWPLYIIPEQLPAAKEFFDDDCSNFLRQRCQQINFDAVLLGPGLGRKPETSASIWSLLQYLIASDIPIVLDADALYILAQQSPGQWPKNEEQDKSHGPRKIMRGIATPHRGELQRWLGTKNPGEIIDSAREKIAGKESTAIFNNAEQQVIFCSGSTDELHGDGGRFARAEGGHPRMACAGTGDLLAGLCASFMAQGMNPWPAARLAAHTLRGAGILAGKEFGIGLVADDLPLYIGKALQHNMQALAPHK